MSNVITEKKIIEEGEITGHPEEEDIRNKEGTLTTSEEDRCTPDIPSCLTQGYNQESKAETSSEEKVQNLCEYNNRGFCSLHKRKGERYIETTTVWKDRGGGRGFGNVYKRRVKYMCRSQNNRIIRPMSSSIKNEESVS